MSLEETTLTLLNRLFEEAVRRHGADLPKVVGEVEAQIAAMGADRTVVDGAFERALAFRAPMYRDGPLH